MSRREYTLLAVFVTMIPVLLLLFLGMGTAIAFIVGAATSAAVGMLATVGITMAIGDPFKDH